MTFFYVCNFHPMKNNEHILLKRAKVTEDVQKYLETISSKLSLFGLEKYKFSKRKNIKLR